MSRIILPFRFSSHSYSLSHVHVRLPGCIIAAYVTVMEFRHELSPAAMPLPDSPNYKSLLDNLIPLGDMVRPFLCQFSPSLLFKPPLSSCSPTMQDRAVLFFSCSLIPHHRAPRQHAVYANDPPFMLHVE